MGHQLPLGPPSAYFRYPPYLAETLWPEASKYNRSLKPALQFEHSNSMISSCTSGSKQPHQTHPLVQEYECDSSSQYQLVDFVHEKNNH